APTKAELDVLERELNVRRHAAATALRARPPEARPSVEHCRYCSVRHLCDEYWQPTTVLALAGAIDTTPFADVDMSIVGRQGPSSWDGILEQSRTVAPRRRVLMRTASPNRDFRVGDRIRVLGAHVSVAEDESQPAVVTIGTMTETFLVSRPSPG